MVLVDKAGNKKEMIVSRNSAPVNLSLPVPTKKAAAPTSQTSQTPLPDSPALRSIFTALHYKEKNKKQPNKLKSKFMPATTTSQTSQTCNFDFETSK
jgi:hypothetical protein